MKQPKITKGAVRYSLLIGANLILAHSVALCKVSLFGIDPFQSCMAGLGLVFDFLPFNVTYTIANVVLFIAMAIWGRRYIGFGTFIGIFVFGTLLDWAQTYLGVLFADASFLVRCGVLAVGLGTMMVGIAMYFTADLGVSAYDFVALEMAERKVAQYRYCRIFLDVVCVVIAFLCGVRLDTGLGVGTIITACCMGPGIAYMREHVTDPFLAKFPEAASKKKKAEK